MKKHIVKQGETLASIGLKYQFADWNEIYQHEANSRFREFRKDPNCIAPGDVLYIPEAEPIVYKFVTDQKHVIKVKVPKQKVKIRFLDVQNKAIQTVRYELHIKNGVIEGSTSSGLIEEEIPVRDNQTVHLKIWPDEKNPDISQEYQIMVGGLDPTEEISGIQGRLQNLGYYGVMVDNDYGEYTVEAILEFQADYDLPLTGEMDAQTLAKLNEIHANE